MSLSGKLRALRRQIDQRGLFGAVALAVRELARELFLRDEILFTLALPRYSASSAGDDEPGGGVRRIDRMDDLTPADRAALDEYGGEGYLATIGRRLEAGWILFLVDLDGRAAGGGWALTPATSLASKVVPLLEGDVTIIDCFTFPALRGRGAYPMLLAGIAEHFEARGYLRAFIFTRRHNVASVRGIEKAGFERALVYWTFGLGRSEIVVWRRRA